MPRAACCTPPHRPQVFQGVLLAEPNRFGKSSGFGGHVTSAAGYLLGLWRHEAMRVFADKLVTIDDKAWVETGIEDLLSKVGGRAQVGGWGVAQTAAALACSSAGSCQAPQL